MKREVLELGRNEGFLGGYTVCLLRVTLRKDETISLTAGQELSDEGHTSTLWSDSICRIRTLSGFAAALENTGSDFGCDWTEFIDPLRNLGEKWGHPLLKDLSHDALEASMSSD